MIFDNYGRHADRLGAWGMFAVERDYGDYVGRHRLLQFHSHKAVDMTIFRINLHGGAFG